MIRRRHVIVLVWLGGVAALADPWAALGVLVFVVGPLLWLLRGVEIAGRAVKRRGSMTAVAGPARVYGCTYCPRAADGWDHVIPRAQGGSDEAWNLTPACTPCNSSKGDDTPEQWWRRTGRGAPYPAHWPRTEGAAA